MTPTFRRRGARRATVLALLLGLAGSVGGVCFGKFCIPDSPSPQPGGRLMGSFWWTGKPTAVDCSASSAASCMALCAGSLERLGAGDPASCLAFTFRAQDSACGGSSACYQYHSVTGSEPAAAAVEVGAPLDSSGVVQQQQHAAVCGTVGSSVVVSEQSQVINAGPGRCVYAADAGACCDLCAAYPDCAAWFFNTAPGWECDEGDQDCKAQQQAPDSCSADSCTLYSGFYELDDAFVAYGITSGAFVGRTNLLAGKQAPQQPDPAADKGQTLALAFDYAANKGTAVNEPCEYFADSEEDCLEACNSQRYEATALGLQGCRAYALNSANKTTCFDELQFPKAGECVMYWKVASVRALAEADGDMVYGTTDPSVIAPLPDPSPEPPSFFLLKFTVVVEGPGCIKFRDQYERALRREVAQLAGVTRPMVAVSCSAGATIPKSAEPGVGVGGGASAQQAQQGTEAAAEAASPKGGRTRRLVLTVSMRARNLARATVLKAGVQQAIRSGGLRQALQQALPGRLFTLQQLPRAREVSCSGSGGATC